MSFKKRLQKLQLEFDLNGRSFATHLGYKDPEKIQRLTRDEKNSPSYKILQDIITSFPNVNAYWLLTGQGEMFVNVDKNNITEKSNDNSYAERELEFKTKELELQKKETERLEKLIARYEKLLDK